MNRVPNEKGRLFPIGIDGKEKKCYIMTKPTLYIGSLCTCKVRIYSRGVLPEHCKLSVGISGEAFLESLGGSALTFLNDLRVTQKVALKQDDVITVYKKRFRFSYRCDSKYFKRAAMTPIKPYTSLESSSKRIFRYGTSKSTSPKKSGYKTLFSQVHLACRKRSRSDSGGCIQQPPLKKRLLTPKRVTFGPRLSPEEFDKHLPPCSPIYRGSVPGDNRDSCINEHSILKRLKLRSDCRIEKKAKTSNSSQHSFSVLETDDILSENSKTSKGVPLVDKSMNIKSENLNTFKVNVEVHPSPRPNQGNSKSKAPFSGKNISRCNNSLSPKNVDTISYKSPFEDSTSEISELETPYVPRRASTSNTTTNYKSPFDVPESEISEIFEPPYVSRRARMSRSTKNTKSPFEDQANEISEIDTPYIPRKARLSSTATNYKSPFDPESEISESEAPYVPGRASVSSSTTNYKSQFDVPESEISVEPSYVSRKTSVSCSATNSKSQFHVPASVSSSTTNYKSPFDVPASEISEIFEPPYVSRRASLPRKTTIIKNPLDAPANEIPERFRVPFVPYKSPFDVPESEISEIFETPVIDKQKERRPLFSDALRNQMKPTTKPRASTSSVHTAEVSLRQNVQRSTISRVLNRFSQPKVGSTVKQGGILQKSVQNLIPASVKKAISSTGHANSPDTIIIHKRKCVNEVEMSANLQDVRRSPRISKLEPYELKGNNMDKVVEDANTSNVCHIKNQAKQDVLKKVIEQTCKQLTVSIQKILIAEEMDSVTVGKASNEKSERSDEENDVKSKIIQSISTETSMLPECNKMKNLKSKNEVEEIIEDMLSNDIFLMQTIPENEDMKQNKKTDVGLPKGKKAKKKAVKNNIADKAVENCSQPTRRVTRSMTKNASK